MSDAVHSDVLTAVSASYPAKFRFLTCYLFPLRIWHSLSVLDRLSLLQLYAFLAQIAEASTLSESTRQLATEFLVTLCEAREKAPGMMRKLPQINQRLFQCLMGFLLDIEVPPSP
jgi:hypothetical protein